MNQGEGVPMATITPQPKPISCCDEELVDVEIEALRQGAEQAHRDGENYLTTMGAVSKAAAAACNRALEVQYLPLDERKFREVFTLTWCAGYRSETRPH